MHTLFDRRPRRVVAIEVGLVHGQRKAGDLNLAGQPGQSRQLRRPGVTEPLAARHQSAQTVATDAGLDARLLLQDSHPPRERDASGSDPEILTRHRGQRGGQQAPAVERDDAAGLFEERPVSLADALADAVDIDAAIDALDPDPDVAQLLVDPLRDLAQLVGLEPAAVTVLAVLEAPRDGVARLADLHREPLAKVAESGLATLPVPAEQVATPLDRAAPPQVVALDLTRPHPLTAGRHDLDQAAAHRHVDRQPDLRQTGVDGVVDQLEESVDRIPVVREQ